ncbi:putative endo-1,3-1,4-beta-D-glucanase [Macrophomina phaseolina]|uniref:Endo-1,3-1,4-beta-D-glucanase n=1 Tax=Macrophomina phaseolina TaxID=35725 RepID=A0ABQ8G2Q3_9PEZI|nr:putative endo-1,3-1,4-beta-D-glucanase [Macrophomina phaseolina]
MGDCCIKGFHWDAKPKGRDGKLAGRDCYITGSNANVAIMIIHDLFGWTFSNTRILADHYAREVDATVYIPDFFGGEIIPVELIIDKSRWPDINLPAFIARNSKTVREPEIFGCARALRSRHRRVGAVGFCYGGWGVFRLGAKRDQEQKLVDCISAAHPTLLEEREIENVGVPVQILAPEIDPQFTEELKSFSNRVIPRLGVPYDYQHFPGLEHGFAVRGDPEIPGEREGLERAKAAVVLWMLHWLRDN